jgi:chemotaxis protein methyltransferase CheR
MGISPQELREFANYIQEVCGISLDEGKAYLVESRLGDLLKETASSTYGELLTKVRRDLSRKLERSLIDRITTNETSFFRDLAPFDLLQHKLIPDLIDRRLSTNGPIPIRIWSAASSTGQEVYSLAILLKELLGNLAPYDIRILGTDISDQAVAKASRGTYSRLELERGLSSQRIQRHFVQEGSDAWKIQDELRAMARFQRMNLLAEPPVLGRFDLVLCRNVAIYFTEEDRRTLFSRIERCLEPNGSLIIGATESISGICPQFVSLRHLRSVYYQVQTTAQVVGKSFR